MMNWPNCLAPIQVYEAWNRLSSLIQTGPPTLEIEEGSDLSLADKREEVIDALFEAAKERNVPAIMKWLDLHRGQFDEPEAKAMDGEAELGPGLGDHSDTIKALEQAFMD